MEAAELLKNAKEKHGINFTDEEADYKNLLSLIRYALHVGYNEGWKDRKEEYK